jgi:hypothetical protein
VCHDGRTDAACGTSGQACSDCVSQKLTCAPSGFCYNGPHCGPDTCAGCCGADGQCRPGTGAANCGSYGDLCENCNSTGETCLGGTCGVRGATCPAPYAGCNPGSATSPPAFGKSCTASTLEFVAGACKGATSPASCAPALQMVAQTIPGCFDCLQQFLYDGAVAKCLAPFLSPTCNHQFTCYSGCQSTACGQCTDAARSGCQSTAAGTGGDCASEVSGAYCAAAAFSGPASFCSLQGVGDVGAWLRGVGTYYCSG